MKTAALLFTTALGCASAFSPSESGLRTASSTQLHETKADLEAIAAKLNPVVNYYDPLGMVDIGPWGYNQEQTIGWFRHAEIKHGRVAMMAFVGYWVQSNFQWPWDMTMSGSPFPSTDLSPPEQWDALPYFSKVQIIAFVGFLEWYSELSYDEASGVGSTHYTKGGVPGKYPPFAGGIPHPVPFNLYDPFGIHAGMSPEKKEKRLIMEINNGRLAMIGIMGFLSEQALPGSVPLLSDIVKPYSGQVMAPFEVDWA